MNSEWTTVSIRKKDIEAFHRAVFKKHKKVRGALGEEVANALRAYLEYL